MDPKKCSENSTIVPEFLLLGFQTPPCVKPLLFLIFFGMSLFTITGNSLILVMVSCHNHLHKPMYFFLGNLSFLEIWYTTNLAPTILGGLWPDGRTLSVAGCLTQCFFVGLLVGTECLLLTVMAYDRYVAICYPLHYTTLMGQQLCLQLAVSTWVAGFTISSLIIFPVGQLKFLGLNVVDHFFCDLAPILKAACLDTSMVEIEILVMSVFVFLIPFPVIIVSYTFIIMAILKIPSTTGRDKAFSTCSSHLAVVITYFCTLITMYSVPKTGQSLSLIKALSLLYTMATPMLNPIIYTLRNKDIREALRSVLRKKLCLPRL